MQPDEDGKDRKVWIFPLRMISGANVKKPAMYVFKNMEEYKERGNDIDRRKNRV